MRRKERKKFPICWDTPNVPPAAKTEFSQSQESQLSLPRGCQGPKHLRLWPRHFSVSCQHPKYQLNLLSHSFHPGICIFSEFEWRCHSADPYVMLGKTLSECGCSNFVNKNFKTELTQCSRYLAMHCCVCTHENKLTSIESIELIWSNTTPC